MSTDHKVVADSHLSRAAECVIELPLGSPDQMAYLATAQVHATLYAAEQQRIANLMEAAVMYGSNPAGWPSEIREGLGLA